MNVIISNERQNEISNLDIEIIKSIHGIYNVDELIQTFSNFFFGRMILDLTALEGYKDIRNLQKLSMSLDVEKIIVLLPNEPECLSPTFLSKLISMGIYNFTTNLDGINYLLNNPNTYRDVAHLHQIEDNQIATMSPMGTGETTIVNNVVNVGTYVLGIKNITDHSGATSLIYMLKNVLTSAGKSVLAIEVDKRDFSYFNDKNMISINNDTLANEVLKHKDVNIILIDLNKEGSIDVCNEVLYLIEPSTLKLNKVMLKDRKTFEKLAGRKVVLCPCLLNDNDVKEFEYEANTKVFYKIPPLDERSKKMDELQELLSKLGIY